MNEKVDEGKKGEEADDVADELARSSNKLDVPVVDFNDRLALPLLIKSSANAGVVVPIPTFLVPLVR